MSNESMANYITDVPSAVAELLAINEQLQKQLNEANEVLKFYGDMLSYYTSFHLPVTSTSNSDCIDRSDLESIEARDKSYKKDIGGKRARQYLAKYKLNDT